MNVKKEIASNLKRIRKERGMSQQKAAEYLGLTQGLISQYEKGTTVPSVEVLADYAVKFHVSLDYIFGLTRSEAGTIFKTEVLEAMSAPIASPYGNPDAPGEIDVEAMRKLIDEEIRKKTEKK